jgi:hypothetical protein
MAYEKNRRRRLRKRNECTKAAAIAKIGSTATPRYRKEKSLTNQRKADDRVKRFIARQKEKVAS